MMKRRAEMRLAIMERNAVRPTQTQFEKGDAMFLYTDGQKQWTFTTILHRPGPSRRPQKLNKNYHTDIMNGADVNDLKRRAPRDVILLFLHYVTKDDVWKTNRSNRQ